MICNKCGMQNPDGSAFCSYCGATMEAPRQTRSNNDYSQPIDRQPDYQPEYQPDYPSTQHYQQPRRSYSQQSYGYPRQVNPRLNAPGSNKSEKVLFIIAGVLACIAFILPFLPSMTLDFTGLEKIIGSGIQSIGLKQKYSLNAFSFASSLNDATLMPGIPIQYASIIRGIGTFAVMIFVVPMAILVPWAVLSFMRKKIAGVFGIVSSTFLLAGSIMWFGLMKILQSVFESIFQTGSYSGYNSEYYNVLSNMVKLTPVPIFLIIIAIAGIAISIAQLFFIVKKNNSN